MMGVAKHRDRLVEAFKESAKPMKGQYERSAVERMPLMRPPMKSKDLTPEQLAAVRERNPCIQTSLAHQQDNKRE